jgi:hypothetical protein
LYKKSDDQAVYAFIAQQGRARPRDIQRAFRIPARTQGKVTARLIKAGQVIKEDGWFYPLGVEIGPSCQAFPPNQEIGPSCLEIGPSCGEMVQGGPISPPISTDKKYGGNPAWELPADSDHLQGRPADSNLAQIEADREASLILAADVTIRQHIKIAKERNSKGHNCKRLGTKPKATHGYVEWRGIEELLKGLKGYFLYDRFPAYEPRLNPDMEQAFFMTFAPFSAKLGLDFQHCLEENLRCITAPQDPCNPKALVLDGTLLKSPKKTHKSRGIRKPRIEKVKAPQAFQEADCPF